MSHSSLTCNKSYGLPVSLSFLNSISYSSTCDNLFSVLYIKSSVCFVQLEYSYNNFITLDHKHELHKLQPFTFFGVLLFSYGGVISQTLYGVHIECK